MDSSAMATSSEEKSKMEFDLKTYWRNLIDEINLKLDEATAVRYPEKIYEAIRYSVLAKGAKRAAPIMCIASCELFGGNRLAAFPTACALEMIHAASLIHNDLPCMDDDSSRRGQLSNHKVYGVDVAILAGDALFPLGFDHIVSHTPPNLAPAPILLRVIAEIARVVGSTGMAAGQFMDLHGGVASLERALDKKFGVLGECSAACGGLLAGAEDEEIQRLRRYGKAVGMLYQVADDVLSEAKKTRSSRETQGREARMSYASVHGIHKAMELAEELRAKAKKELDGFKKYGEGVLPLYGFVDFAAYRGFDVIST